jgi:predicted NUDIX family NTP pyrophosphohydrolase
LAKRFYNISSRQSTAMKQQATTPTAKRSRTSAGLLMFRTRNGEVEVLLAHPGGPFFQRKDDGVWTIPKGEAAEGEDLLSRAQIEFLEEIGIAASGPFIDLGSIKQKGGKTVHAWAFEADLPNGFTHRCNTFEMEWPPRSRKLQEFPEVDRVAFFAIPEARRKLIAAQASLLDRLIGGLSPADRQEF